MKIAVLRERKEGELRVAATPDAVKKYVSLGAEVTVETGAGLGAAIHDQDYKAAGAAIAPDAASAGNDAQIILKVRTPEKDELMMMPEGAMLIGMLDPYAERDALAGYNLKRLSAFALELLP